MRLPFRYRVIAWSVFAYALVSSSVSTPPRAETTPTENTSATTNTITPQQAALLRDSPPVVFIKRAAHARKGTNGTMLGQMNLGAPMGSRICVYDPARPDEGARTIFEDGDGFVFDMSLSYDAERILFSFMDDVKRNAGEQKDAFHIWEIGLNGSGLRQLTTGPYHDASPVYLPDGRVVFCSTRVESFSLCQDFLAAALFIMDGDGSNMRRLEYNTLCDTTPYVMDDGSILFTRWEYQDKNIFCTQGLWTINPDGTRLQLFYGNTLTIPNAMYGARQIPGTRNVVLTMAPHHGRPIGAVAVVDRSRGLEAVEAMRSLTPEIPYTPTKADKWNPGNAQAFWGAGDVQFAWAWADPWPIDEHRFVAAYGGPLNGGPNRYRLYLLDDKGTTASLYDDPETSCFFPIPLQPRPYPHLVPGAPPPKPEGEGEFFVADIYRGLEEKGVQRGQVTHLRVMSQIPKEYNTEGPRYHDHYPIIGQGSYYPKIDYGTVPVDAEGRAYFKAPAGVEIYFIAVDSEGREIRRMGTITQLTDGERQGCIGCHESRFHAGVSRKGLAERLARGPDAITPPSWGAGPVSFVRQVQPVLDRYCVRCHSGRNPKGSVDLSSGRERFYNMGYRNLIDREMVEYYYINIGPTGNFQPLQSGSWVSPLRRMIESNHGGVEMDAESRRRIYAWIDANVPYYDTWRMSRPHTQGGRDTWSRLREPESRALEPEPWFAEFSAVFEKNCRECHRAFGAEGHGDDLEFAWINLSVPEYSRVLNAHLSRDAGGVGIWCTKEGDPTPRFESTDDPLYLSMLSAIRKGARALAERPRVDQEGGRAIAQQRNFGKIY